MTPAARGNPRLNVRWTRVLARVHARFAALDGQTTYAAARDSLMFLAFITPDWFKFAPFAWRVSNSVPSDHLVADPFRSRDVTPPWGVAAEGGPSDLGVTANGAPARLAPPFVLEI